MRSKKPSTVETLLEHTGFVRNLARGALGREDGSEDIVQDAWVAALQSGPREAGAERGWFYRVVKNRVTSIARKEATRQKHLRGEHEARHVPSPDEILGREESRRRLVAALLQLDPMYREPLVLKYYEDLRPRDVAARLDLKVETVRTRQRRGVEQLRQLMDADYGDRRSWVVGLLPLTVLPEGPGAGPATSLAASLGLAATVIVAVGIGVAALVSRIEAPAPEPVSGRGVTEAAPDRATLRGRTADSDGRGVLAPARDTALSDAAMFTIVVRDYANEPVVGASIRVAEHRREFFGRLREATSGRTDADGCFRVPRTASPTDDDGVTASNFLLQVVQPEDRADLEDRVIERWRPGDVTITLRRGFVVSGEVHDRSGRGVAGARVALRSGAREKSVVTDTLGRFRVTGLPPGRWQTAVTLRSMTAEASRPGWVLDSGAEGARLEVTAGRRMLIELPWFDPDEHRGLDLHVTAFDPVSGEDVRADVFPVSPDGTAWIYGLDDERRYALWWSDRAARMYAYAADVSPVRAEHALEIRPGRTLHLQVVRPDGWAGWPRITVRARGITADGRWEPNGDYIVEGLPEGEFLVTAEGQDLRNREVIGETRARTGETAVLVLSLR